MRAAVVLVALALLLSLTAAPACAASPRSGSPASLDAGGVEAAVEPTAAALEQPLRSPSTVAEQAVSPDWQQWVPPAYRSFLPPSVAGGEQQRGEGGEGGSTDEVEGQLSGGLHTVVRHEEESEQRVRKQLTRGRRGKEEDNSEHSRQWEREKVEEERTARMRLQRGREREDGGAEEEQQRGDHEDDRRATGDGHRHERQRGGRGERGSSSRKRRLVELEPVARLEAASQAPASFPPPQLLAAASSSATAAASQPPPAFLVLSLLLLLLLLLTAVAAVTLGWLAVPAWPTKADDGNVANWTLADLLRCRPCNCRGWAYQPIDDSTAADTTEEEQEKQQQRAEVATRASHYAYEL